MRKPLFLADEKGDDLTFKLSLSIRYEVRWKILKSKLGGREIQRICLRRSARRIHLDAVPNRRGRDEERTINDSRSQMAKVDDERNNVSARWRKKRIGRREAQAYKGEMLTIHRMILRQRSGLAPRQRTNSNRERF